MPLPLLPFLLLLSNSLTSAAVTPTSATVKSVGRAKCPETELARVKKESAECEDTAWKRFVINPTEETLCTYMQETVMDCTKDFVLCYDDDDAAALRDVVLQIHLDKMLKILDVNEETLQQCEVVQQLYADRSEARNITFSSTKQCESEVVEEAVGDFRYCAEGVLNLLVQKFGNSDSKLVTRKGIICGAISDLVNECYKDLHTCFEEEELTRMRRTQLQLLATFFYHAADNVGFSVVECPVLQEEEEKMRALGTMMGTNWMFVICIVFLSAV